jgi:hypothetical protein
VKTGPANKWRVPQRNLDQFRFWLKDHENPAPTKAGQYSYRGPSADAGCCRRYSRSAFALRAAAPWSVFRDALFVEVLEALARVRLPARFLTMGG